jgi:hypothetical protein
MYAIKGMATDDVGVASVRVSIDGQAPIAATVESGAGTPTATWSYTWFLPSEDNTISHSITATVRDMAGNEYTTASTSVGVDTQAPLVSSFLIEQDASYTFNPNVSLELAASDNSGPLSVSFANDNPNFVGGALTYPPPASSSYPWELSSGDGLKMVYGQVTDRVGNVSAPIWDEINLDSSAPVIASTEPSNEASKVSLTVAPRVTFSDVMDASSINSSSITIWLDNDGDGILGTGSGQDLQVVGVVSYDSASRSATLTPNPPLLPLEKYFIRVASSAKNAAGVALPNPYDSAFYTGGSDTTAPSVISITPANGSAEVSTLGVMRVEFSEPMDFNAILSGDGFALLKGTSRIPGQLVADSPTQTTFYPDGPLEVATAYRVVVGTGSRDLAGNALASSVTSQFTTVETSSSPHGGYTSSSARCQECHLVHGARQPGPYGGSLLIHENENTLCKTCHDGRGASKNVNADFVEGTSGHFLEDGDQGSGRALTTRCSSCHGPHFAAADKPNAFRPQINGQVISGNNSSWCLACHDDQNSWAAENYPYPAGGPMPGRPQRSTENYAGYPVSGTFPGRSAYLATNNAHSQSESMVWPGSSRPPGDCRNCHTAHSSASPYDGLVATYRPTPDASAVLSDRQNGTFAELCLTCHDGSPSAKDIKQYVTFDGDKTGPQYTGGHRIMTAGGNLPAGAPLPCYDCHNPHGSKGNAADAPSSNRHLVSDEQWSGIDTSTTAGVVAFCTKCHLPWEYVETIGEAGIAGTVPTGQLDQIEGLTRWKADNKLSLIPGAYGHTKANMENPTVSCYACHGNNYAAPSATSGFNVHRPGAGQGCAACHAGPQDAGDGGPARRAVVGEFSQGGGHHVDGSVSDRDCGVCHLEGDAATGEIDPGTHKNNALDLRNPDTGDATGLPPFAAFSRDATSAVLEPWVVNVQNSLCLKCHDSDGVASPAARTPTGTNLRPFSAVQGEPAADVNTALAPTNSFHHAVRQAGDNQYTTATPSNGGLDTMVPPWNQGGQRNLISCFDCHTNSAGHGGAYGRMALTDIGNPPSSPNYAGMVELCLRCHKASVYDPRPTDLPTDGSNFTDHRKSDHRLSGGNQEGCRACHAGIENSSGLTSNGAPGSIHGGAFTWPAESDTPGSESTSFLYGGYLKGWQGGTCFPACHESETY